MSNLKNKHSFKKGNTASVGNKGKSGRPSGTLNKINQQRVDFRKKALEDLDSAYTSLRSNMDNNEGWAHAIFWKDLAPKRAFKDTLRINPEIDRLESILAGLATIDEITYEEALEEIKILGAAKLVEKIKAYELAKDDKEKQTLLDKINNFLEITRNKINA